MSRSSKPILELHGICKEYINHYGEAFYALDHVDLVIEKGEFMSIMGPSGSGKTTLANIIGLLSSPSKGRMEFIGNPCDKLRDWEMTLIRNKAIGFIFQDYMLIEHMTALENVMLALHCHSTNRSKAAQKAIELLQSVGLGEQIYKKPKQLSGGQKQRVAVARALIKRPKLILADEPAGALDKKSRIEVLELLQKLNRAGSTIVMVTHNEEDALAGNRLIKISEAKIVQDRKINTMDFSLQKEGA